MHDSDYRRINQKYNSLQTSVEHRVRGVFTEYLQCWVFWYYHEGILQIEKVKAKPYCTYSSVRINVIRLYQN